MVKELDEGNGAECECGICGKKLYIWDGMNESAMHVATHYTLYCSKKCYKAAGEDEE
jgi:hypothetical protein